TFSWKITTRCLIGVAVPAESGADCPPPAAAAAPAAGIAATSATAATRVPVLRDLSFTPDPFLQKIRSSTPLEPPGNLWTTDERKAPPAQTHWSALTNTAARSGSYVT